MPPPDSGCHEPSYGNTEWYNLPVPTLRYNHNENSGILLDIPA